MFLTIQQRYILETLRKLGCVRRCQLHALVRSRFQSDMDISPARLDVMLNQLRRGAVDIRLEDDLVRFPAVKPDPLRLEAIDVMLELTGNRPEDFSARTDPPVLLRFALEESLRLFTVATLSEGPAPAAMDREKGGRTIWLASDGAMPCGLALPRKHFFAVRSPDGTHRFYGSQEL